jgi:hypothetical protein
VFVPFQGLLVSPVLVPVWVAGWWTLLRDPALRRWRAFPVAFVVLVVVFVAVGGKPYYLCGLYPVLLAAGSAATVRWWRRGAGWRRGVVAAAVALSAVIDATLMLPLVPARDLHSTPVVAVNYDAGEQVGWPRFAAQVARVYDALPADERAHAVVLGENYGEAGALARYRPSVPAYATQNSYWDLARPPSSTTTVVALGYSADELARWFGSVHAATTIDNGLDVDDDEQGGTVYVCTDPRRPWPQLWRELRRFG